MTRGHAVVRQPWKILVGHTLETKMVGIEKGGCCVMSGHDGGGSSGSVAVLLVAVLGVEMQVEF